MSTDSSPMGQESRGVEERRDTANPLIPAYSPAALPLAGPALSLSERLRLSLRGAVLGLGACALCAALGLLLAAAIFGSSGAAR